MGNWLEDNKPIMGMLAVQCIYAAVALSIRTALLQGMSPRVFVVYRQAIATLAIAPVAYFFKGKQKGSCIGMRNLSLIFLASLIGVTINQYMFLEGLYFSSSSIATAMGNLVPAITFLIAAVVGLEKVELRSLRSIAKIAGTICCVGGAVSIALLKGPKLLNQEVFTKPSFLQSAGGDNWMLGCVLLFGSCCCWSFWLILQVPMSASCPDHLTLSAWMCCFATLQSGTLTFFLEKDQTAWILNSRFQVICCLHAGVVGSAISFFIQAWCVSKRGPLFTAMFNPLCTVIVTIIASLFLDEKLYAGSLGGAVAVVAGLYVVLWGKSRDHKETTQESEFCDDPTESVEVLVDNNNNSRKCQKIDLQKPLLEKKHVLR